MPTRSSSSQPDLDGTFLGGTETARQGLYRWIEQNREQVGLIFVTGREPRFVRDLCRSGKVPRPDFVVGDVGTTVARMEKELLLAPIAELEEEIASAWGDAGNPVQAKLRGVAGLTAQSTGFRYRMSYDMDPARFDNRALDIVAEMGLDALISDNRFFDVLPKGVSKGPSLLRLLTPPGGGQPPRAGGGRHAETISPCWSWACPPSWWATASPRWSRS